MSVLRVIKRNWGLFRWLGLGFCSLTPRGDRLSFGMVDLVVTVAINLVLIASSWWFIFAVFLKPHSGSNQEVEQKMRAEETVMVVAYVSFFTEQIANNILIVSSLFRQTKVMDICNKLWEFDQQIEKHFFKKGEKKEEEKWELLGLFCFTVSSLIIQLIMMVYYYAYVANSFYDIAELPALVRPLVNDFMNLQFASLVMLINNRIRRLDHLMTTREVRNVEKILPMFLFRLSELIEGTGNEFSGMFLIQSLRIIITADNQLYQLLVIFNNDMFQNFGVTLYFLVYLVIYSVGIYVLVHFTCDRTSAAFERLVNRYMHREGRGRRSDERRLEMRQMLRSGGVLAPSSLSSTSSSWPQPEDKSDLTARGVVAGGEGGEIDGESKIGLHFLHQRNQRLGRGFGFTAFGILDIDLKSSYTMFSLTVMYLFVIMQFEVVA